MGRGLGLEQGIEVGKGEGEGAGVFMSRGTRAFAGGVVEPGVALIVVVSRLFLIRPARALHSRPTYTIQH